MTSVITTTKLNNEKTITMKEKLLDAIENSSLFSKLNEKETKIMEDIIDCQKELIDELIEAVLSPYNLKKVLNEMSNERAIEILLSKKNNDIKNILENDKLFENYMNMENYRKISETISKSLFIKEILMPILIAIRLFSLKKIDFVKDNLASIFELKELKYYPPLLAKNKDLGLTSSHIEIKLTVKNKSKLLSFPYLFSLNLNDLVEEYNTYVKLFEIKYTSSGKEYKKSRENTEYIDLTLFKELENIQIFDFVTLKKLSRKNGSHINNFRTVVSTNKKETLIKKFYDPLFLHVKQIVDNYEKMKDYVLDGIKIYVQYNYLSNRPKIYMVCLIDYKTKNSDIVTTLLRLDGNQLLGNEDKIKKTMKYIADVKTEINEKYLKEHTFLGIKNSYLEEESVIIESDFKNIYICDENINVIKKYLEKIELICKTLDTTEFIVNQ